MSPREWTLPGCVFGLGLFRHCPGLLGIDNGGLEGAGFGIGFGNILAVPGNWPATDVIRF